MNVCSFRVVLGREDKVRVVILNDEVCPASHVGAEAVEVESVVDVQGQCLSFVGD